MKKKEHSNLFADIIFSIFIVLGVLVFSLYYIGKYTFIADITFILIAFYLASYTIIFIRHTDKYKAQYLFISILFFIVSGVHIMRLIYGPLQCTLSHVALSIYLYDGIASIIGLTIIYSSYYLMKRKSGSKFLHLLSIMVGIVMVINHAIKLFLGKCV